MKEFAVVECFIGKIDDATVKRLFPPKGTSNTTLSYLTDKVVLHISECDGYYSRFEVLKVPDLKMKSNGEPDTNNASVVTRFCVSLDKDKLGCVSPLSQQFLFCGDAENELEKELRKSLKAEIEATTVHKLSHHGSSKSSSFHFLETFQKSLLCVTASGNGTHYGHPSTKVFDRIQNLSKRFLGDANPFKSLSSVWGREKKKLASTTVPAFCTISGTITFSLESTNDTHPESLALNVRQSHRNVVTNVLIWNKSEGEQVYLCGTV